MFFLLIPLLFLCITTIINEPLNLARSAVLICWVFSFIIYKPNLTKVRSRWLWLITCIPILYIFSSFVNKQNLILALIGNYNRNFGILTLTAISLLVIYLANSNYSVQKFIYWGLIPITVMSIIYSFIQIQNKDFLVWAETDRVVLTLGNSDYAAALLGILIIVPVYGFFKFEKLIFKILMALPLQLLWNAGIYTQAYQFRVISVVAICIFLVVHYWPVLQRTNFLVRLFSILTITMGVIYFVVSNRSELITRTSFEDRISQQKMGLRMFLDHPFTGVGVDQFWRFSPKYLTPGDIKAQSSLVVPDKTHNLIVDHLAMGGFFVGAVFLIFLIYSVVLTLRVNNLGSKLENRKEFALLSGIWISYVFHLFLSTDNIFMLTLGYSSFGLIAQIYYHRYSTLKVPSKSRVLTTSGIRIFSISILIIGSLINLRAITADFEIKKITSNQVQDGDAIIKTLRSFPNPQTAEQVIVYLLQNLQNCPIAVVASDNLLALDNRSAQAWYFKALCNDAASDQKQAFLNINQAIKFQPQNLIYLDAKLRLAVSLKHFDEAVDIFRKIKDTDPTYFSLNSLELLLETIPKSELKS